MKQIIQHLDNGATLLEEVPAPMVRKGHLLVQSACSLVSAGTERMLVSFGKAGWIGKALQQPERLQMVADKIRTDGLKPTLQAVRNKISQPIPLGYSNAGTVIAVGEGVSGFRVGDRVVSNGPHAEVVCVPQNLAAKIPESVSDESACFTVVAAIALQGIRLVSPAFGETVVIIGLGLIGQLTVQLLLANGCRVIGIDTDEQRCKQAGAWYGISCIHTGAGQDPLAAVQALTHTGADAVIITASAKTDSIISEAAGMSRKRGRIILVGVVGLQLKRADFYEKELSFQVSCSYGPGRYDYNYEQLGQDYPAGFVRWTAQRNFEAVLQAMAAGKLDTTQLTEQRLPITKYKDIYDHMGQAGYLASVFIYDTSKTHEPTIRITAGNSRPGKGSAVIIGSGSFCSSVLLPSLKKNAAEIRGISSEKGLSAALLAKQYGVALATTDNHSLLSDREADTVFITTRHDTHAALCIAALEAGKHVFVEKPLAITAEQLQAITVALSGKQQLLHTGFNRRFAPLAIKMKQLLGSHTGPVNIVITINAGTIAANHWLSDPALSGGRIIGEACHFIDLASFLCNDNITAVCSNNGQGESAAILLRYSNGSTAVINYLTNGSKAYDKERVEVYTSGKTLVLENWKKLSGYGFKGFSAVSGAQDKGHAAQFRLFLEAIRKGGPALIPFDSIYNTSAAAIAAAASSGANSWITIPQLT